MDFPLHPDYHAQITGNPRVGTQPENPYARATADDFYQSVDARLLVTHVKQQAPGMVAPSSMGELRPDILAIHEAQLPHG
eukprot:77862-Pyramimonas_sp.AAC.1